MKTFFRIVCTVLACGSTAAFCATHISADVTNNSVDWANAQVTGQFIQPAGYQPVQQLVNTTRWTPGIAVSSKTVNLSNGVDNVVLDLASVGLEYDFGGNSSSLEQNPLAGSVSCTESFSAGTKILITSNQTPISCFSDDRVVYTNPVQPFYYVRPVFTIADADMISAFNSKTSGVYRGVLPIQYRYSYRNQGGVITYRNLTASLSFAITYRPNDISNVIVTPPVVSMTPNYDRAKQEIDSSASVSIVVNGELNSGLTLYLANEEYKLLNQSSEIPINIDCATCSPSRLVTDGVRNFNKSSIPSLGSSANFYLDFSYSGIKFTDLIDGNYSNNFTFVVEANF
ncbi:hypothetical protein JCM19232_4231 [Vibrio ishigakensis]|uniref:Fimbrial protein n=1 Tax=Vibrio ishigakensis TaxID=1481914 RepID=A0A0B8PG10_9VIBR|nr:hypothetical protein JCM19232_4231 [Vibrio ishigakensis]